MIQGDKILTVYYVDFWHDFILIISVYTDNYSLTFGEATSEGISVSNSVAAVPKESPWLPKVWRPKRSLLTFNYQSLLNKCNKGFTE